MASAARTRGARAWLGAVLCAGLIVPAQALARSPQRAEDGGGRSGNTEERVADDERERQEGPNRLFAVPPRESIVERRERPRPLSTAKTLHLAARESLDPHGLMFVGAWAGLAQLQEQDGAWGPGWSGYARRAGTTFSDNAIGTMMTTGVLPALLRQDPRYYELGEGSGWHRAMYAASRSVVTRSRAGRGQFNFSEVGGDAVAALLSNTYYPESERSAGDVLSRFAVQWLWHTASNELKEFWPDIRRKLRQRHQKRPAGIKRAAESSAEGPIASSQ